jgi:16S rRNA (guanine527-N7)-methyltransferase
VAPSPLTPEQIRQILYDCRLECDSALAERVQTYLEFLAKWNARMNLTAIQHPIEVLKVLLAESFFAAVLVGDPKGAILDIGSGAGFPGLAMAVYRPELELILLEPRGKRAAFLAALRRELGLAKLAVWNQRLEECAKADFSELPTVLTMRAVGGIEKVVERGATFLQGERRILLFSSVQTAKSTMDDVKGVCWQPEVPIPWEPTHLILLGHAIADVPRGTLHST